MSNISELAIVDSKAKLGPNVSIGPFCVIGPEVEIGENCILKNNVTIEGNTIIGRENVFYQNVVVGVAPQDLKYNGARTKTIIGKGNVFRENVTIHRGTEMGKGQTVIGNGNLFMVAVHVAHDCLIGDKNIIGNQTQLAGHVEFEDGAVISAFVGIHHFCRVGKYSYVAGMTPVRRDVPPFMKFSGDPNAVRAVNEEGLKRNDFSEDDILQLRQAYRKLYRHQRNIAAMVEEILQETGVNQYVRYLCEFIQKSIENRFGRYNETFRRDGLKERRRRRPHEVRGQRD